jgi:DNA-directed RNA polymerase sigma subunit (sigma70/sigma32)
MEREVEERFERIEAILHAMAERENQMEIRWAKNFERAERLAEERHRRAEARMDRFDRQLQATRKLVTAGVKFVARIAVENRQLGKRVDALTRDIAELARMQRAFLRSQRNGRNGGNGGSKRRGTL